MVDYYAVLGITKTASKDDIKKAYHKAALRTHPDRVAPEQKSSAEAAFRQVNAAYEILSDDKNRKLYDTHGVWPPPQEPAQPSYPQRSTYDQRNFSAPPFFSQPFAFTDPFQLFNSMFAEFNHQMNQFHAAATASHSRHQAAPGFPDPFTSFGGAMAPYPPNGGFPSYGAQQFTGNPQPAAPSAEHTFSTAGAGWIKESKVTKVIPSGQRETTIRKTDYNGVVYITRIAGDGTERHFTSYNGVEAPSPHPIPIRAPPPGSAPPPPHNRTPTRTPPSNRTPPSSASTSKSRESPLGPAPAPAAPTHTQPESYRQPRAVRAENPVPLMTANYRVASPSPLSAPATTPGSFALSQESASTFTTQRSVSPSPLRPTASEDPSSLRRQATLPNYQNASAPMPRPQSPHFYRTRTSSEALKPTSSRLKTSHTMPPTTGPSMSRDRSGSLSYSSAPENSRTKTSMMMPAPAPAPAAAAQSVPPTTGPSHASRTGSHSKKSSISKLVGDYFAPKKSHPVPDNEGIYVTSKGVPAYSSSYTPGNSMDSVFGAGGAPPAQPSSSAEPRSHRKHSSSANPMEHKQPTPSSSRTYDAAPRSQPAMVDSRGQTIPPTTTSRPSSRSRSSSKAPAYERREAPPPSSMLFGTSASAAPAATGVSSSGHRSDPRYRAAYAAAPPPSVPASHYRQSANPLPHPPAMVDMSSQYPRVASHSRGHERRHQQVV